MRTQIQRSLFFMGLIAVVITFVMSAVMYYQGMQGQHIRELQMTTYTASQALHREDKQEGISYLEGIYKENPAGIHIVWLDKTGEVLYDSEGDNREPYAEQPEVQQGFKEGESFSIHKSWKGLPKEFYTHKAKDGTLLRISSTRTLNSEVFTVFIPEIVLFVFVFAVGCVLVAMQQTSTILKPLESLAEMVGGLMTGENDLPVPGGYNELIPLIDKVKEQRQQINDYLKDLEEDRSTMHTVVNTISDGIILLNKDKEVIDYNDRIKKIFDFNGNRRYRKVSTIYHDEDWLRAISRAYQEDGSQQYTMTLFHSPFEVIFTRTALVDGQVGLLIVFRDLSAQYAAERMRREFSANVSHELKTPLTSISGFAEMIASGMYGGIEDLRMFGNRIFEESKRMTSLVDTILHLSKLEENDTTITWNTVNMQDVVSYVVDVIQSQAHRRDVKIQVESGPVYVHGNQPLLSELVMNLIDNAVKYNQTGGEVLVHLERNANGEMLFWVKDTGIGIPKDKQERVFERFYRVESSRSKGTGGTGLGLAICKHIVSRHHGTVSINSIEGEGTVVTVIIPAMTDEQVFAEAGNTLKAHEEAAMAQQAALEDVEIEEAERVKGKNKLKKEKKNKKTDSIEQEDSKDKKKKKKGKK